MKLARNRSLWALLLIVAAVALVAAGCGGGSDEASSDGGETTLETTETTETTETDATETETTEDEGSGAAAFANEDCRELVGIGEKFSEAFGTTGAQADLGKSSELFDELADKAPDEIADDLAVFAEAWKELVAALADVDFSSGEAPSAEAIAKLQELGETFDTPELKEASQNIQAWAEENCGATP